MKSYLFKPKEKSRAIKMRFVFFALLPLMLISASSSAYAQEYTITFSLDDGTFPEGVQNPIHYTVENRPTELPTPGKIGYEFGGWYTTSSMESGTEFNSIPDDLAEDITLYAKWNIISYNITYKLKDADDFDGDLIPDYPADNSANQPTYDINGYTFADPTRLAFTFIGWWNNTNSTQYTEIPSGTTGNFTVNAGWKKNWYVLMFDKGYTDAEGSIEDVQFDVSKPSITLPEVSYTHAGYEHTNKWVARDANGDPVYYNGGATLSTVDEYKELISLPSSLTPSSFRITFVPDWAPKIFKVTFKDGETTFSGPTEVAYLADIPLPATDPTKTGYTFDGWDNLPLNRKMPAGDLTLNAQWTPIRYTITFNTDGGSAVEPITADYGSAVTAPAAPTKTGYTFAGWDPVLPATMPLNGLTVTAKWSKTYTITFSLDNGTFPEGVQNPILYTVENRPTELPTPEKIGYEFAGWYTTSSKESGTEFNSIPADLAEDITLYADWNSVYYDITYYLRDDSDNDGDGNPDYPADNRGNQAKYDINGYTFAAPTRPGYTFSGWFDKDRINKYTEIESGTTGPFAVYAVWILNSYFLEFDKGAADAEGSIDDIEFDLKEESVTLPEASYTRAGYEYTRWVVRDANGDPVYYNAGATLSTVDEYKKLISLSSLYYSSYYHITFVPDWTPKKYAVSLPAGLEFVGTDIPADHKFVFGSTVSFKVSDGYEICATSNNPSADVAGVSISENNGTYSFTVPASDVAISADFMADVTLTVSIDGGGWTYGDAPKTPSVTKNGSPLADLTGITFTYKDSKGEIVSSISSTTPAGNYIVTVAYTGSECEKPATIEPANFTIGKSALYVTAEAKSKSYGEDDPALTYQVKDHNGNPVSADLITIALKRAEGENPGTYAITVDENVTADLSDKNNYTYGGFTGANFTIGKGKIIVAAKNQEVAFAGVGVKPEADLTPAISGLRPGDNADDVLNQGTLSWGNEWFDYQVYNNHPYTIECSGFSIKEPYKDFYEVTCKAGVLTIIQAPLDIVVDNLSKYVGAADPAFTYHIQGLKGSDKYNPDQAVRKGDLVRESGEDAGEYEIHESSSRKFSILSTQQGAKNYTINIVPGKFTIRDNYMVEFHSDYGTPPAPIYVAGGNTVTSPTDGNMTDDHYTFDGNWYTDETFATQFLFGSDVVSGDVHLYAKWTPNELYTVTLPEGFEFVDNPSAGQECGFGFGSVVKFKVSDSYKLDGNVTSDVANLYIAKDAKGIYYFEMPVSDVKVNGKAKIKVTITVTLDDFKYGHPIQPVIYKDGVEISDPDPSLYLISYIEKRSYNYVRDISKASVGEYYVSVQYYGTETESSEASDDVPFKITQADITITVDAKTKFSDEDDPELTYKAEGLAEFDKNKDLSELFTGKLVRSNAGVNEPGTYDITQGDLALKSSNYTIKAFNSGVLTIYTPQIVTFHTVRGTAPAPMKVANGKPFSAPTDGNMTSAGYTFSGDWYTDESFDRKWDFDTDVTDKDLDLYAKWGDPIEYNITFDTDGGSDIDPITYTIESETIDLSTIKAEKPYYDFVKWVDNNGTEVKQISKGSYGDIALKANYAPSQYSITFDVDGGSNIDPIAYTIESETIDLSAIKTEKVGYHFVKWLDDKDAEVTQIVKGSNGNVALTALFEAHSFTKYIYNNDATTETDGTETAVCDHEGCNAIDVRIAEGTKLPCSISDEPTESVVIYAHHNTIVVENAVEDIFIYDIDGRCVANRDAASHVSITMQREGIYIVKCGNTVKRVLVM